MRPWLVLAAALGVALAAEAPAAAGPAPDRSARPLQCAASTLRVAGFAHHHAVVVLDGHRAHVGLGLRRPLRRLRATLFDNSSCIDTIVCVVGEPCEPPVQPAPRTTVVRVARIAGVLPRVAVADLRSPNVVYVGRAGARCLLLGRGTALARCLRAESR